MLVHFRLRLIHTRQFSTASSDRSHLTSTVMCVVRHPTDIFAYCVLCCSSRSGCNWTLIVLFYGSARLFLNGERYSIMFLIRRRRRVSSRPPLRVLQMAVCVFVSNAHMLFQSASCECNSTQYNVHTPTVWLPGPGSVFHAEQCACNFRFRILLSMIAQSYAESPPHNWARCVRIRIRIHTVA